MHRRTVLAWTGLGALGLAGCTGPSERRTGGETTAPADRQTGTAGSTETPTGSGGEPNGEETTGDRLEVAYSFSASSPDCGRGNDDATIAFDEGSEAVRVDGRISGADLCERAQLAGVDYDEGESLLTVAVETVPRAECSGGDVGAGQCLVEIPYEGTFEPGEMPATVRVTHDGVEIAVAAPAAGR